jgi:putative transposase
VSEKSLRSGANFGFSVPAKAQPRTPRYETTSWLLWYNRTRMHSTLNYVSRVKFEQDWMDATVKIAA